jgi:DNA-binding GntR family transcriptional regulator
MLKPLKMKVSRTNQPLLRTTTQGGGSVLTSNSLVGQAHETISRMIMNHKLRGGDVVVEARLAADLGISRTPLREALQRLEGEGLLTKYDNRNFMVRRVDMREYLQSLKLRLLIETDAAANAALAIPQVRLAAMRIELEQLQSESCGHTEAHWLSDDRLHTMILEYCGNDVAARVIAQLRSTTRLYEVEALSTRLGHDCTEHLRIVTALEARSPEGAHDEMRKHLQSLIDFVFSLFPPP